MRRLCDRRAIALARLPNLIRDAARDFSRLTGLPVATTLACPPMQGMARGLPSPRCIPGAQSGCGT